LFSLSFLVFIFSAIPSPSTHHSPHFSSFLASRPSFLAASY